MAAREDDLATIPGITDDKLVSALRERFLSDTIYTSIGPTVLVAVNPHKYVGSNADTALVQYAAEYRETTEEKEYRPPHIFQLANNAYYHMRRTSQDQAILITYAHPAFHVLPPRILMRFPFAPAAKPDRASRRVVASRSRASLS